MPLARSDLRPLGRSLRAGARRARGGGRCRFASRAVRRLSATVAAAAPPRIKSTAKTWTVDDILLAESADELDVAPDGRTAVG